MKALGIDQMFYRNPKGQEVVYPFGIGRGYVVPSSSAKTRLRKALKVINITDFSIFGVIIIFVIYFDRFDLLLWYIGISIILKYLITLSFVSGLQLSSENFTLERRFQEISIHSGFFSLSLKTIFSFSLVAISIVPIVRENLVASLFGVIFFGICSFVFLKALMTKIKNYTRQGGPV